MLNTRKQHSSTRYQTHTFDVHHENLSLNFYPNESYRSESCSCLGTKVPFPLSNPIDVTETPVTDNGTIANHKGLLSL